MKKKINFFKYLENIPSDFKQESIIIGDSEEFLFITFKYREHTFFYFLFLNYQNKEKILAFNPFCALRYSKDLDDLSFKKSFEWIEKKFHYITNYKYL